MQPRCNLTNSYINGTLILLFPLGVGLGGVGWGLVGWGGVVGVVENEAISAQPTELELD